MGVILNTVTQGSLPGEEAFEQRPEGSEDRAGRRACGQRKQQAKGLGDRNTGTGKSNACLGVVGWVIIWV